MTEQQMQSKIMNALKPFYFVKVISTSKAGTPDIIGCIDGQFISIECKSETGKVSPLQQYTAKLISKNQGMYFVARPSNYKIIIESLLNFNSPDYSNDLF